MWRIQSFQGQKKSCKLQWASSGAMLVTRYPIMHTSVCVCVCVCACARVCAHANKGAHLLHQFMCFDLSIVSNMMYFVNTK
ncbi:hypothetical protein CY35_17G021700 [Sphagnum magellanicum]|nr:hypothetical protein CY35_17G021700 [Sphagnum magellanicum]